MTTYSGDTYTAERTKEYALPVTYAEPVLYGPVTEEAVPYTPPPGGDPILLPGGGLAPTGPVTDTCTRCKPKPAPSAPTAPPIAGVPAPAPAPTTTAPKSTTIPWYEIAALILAALTLAEASKRG